MDTAKLMHALTDAADTDATMVDGKAEKKVVDSSANPIVPHRVDAGENVPVVTPDSMTGKTSPRCFIPHFSLPPPMHKDDPVSIMGISGSSSPPSSPGSTPREVSTPHSGRSADLSPFFSSMAPLSPIRPHIASLSSAMASVSSSGSASASPSGSPMTLFRQSGRKLSEGSSPVSASSSPNSSPKQEMSVIGELLKSKLLSSLDTALKQGGDEKANPLVVQTEYIKTAVLPSHVGLFCRQQQDEKHFHRFRYFGGKFIGVRIVGDLGSSELNLIPDEKCIPVKLPKDIFQYVIYNGKEPIMIVGKGPHILITCLPRVAVSGDLEIDDKGQIKAITSKSGNYNPEGAQYSQDFLDFQTKLVAAVGVPIPLSHPFARIQPANDKKQ